MVGVWGVVGFGVVGGDCMGAALPFSVIAGLSKKMSFVGKDTKSFNKRTGLLTG